MKKTGIILVNLGSPKAPTPNAVADYLWQFLRDKRVVDLPAWKWWPLLKCVILPHRAKRVAHDYANIWTAQGSLLHAISQQQQKLLQQALNAQGFSTKVELAMTYGEPSMEQAVAKLEKQGVEKLVVFPLFPQYSSSTTGAVWDAFVHLWQTRRDLPPMEFIHSYADNPSYIHALVESIERRWQKGTFLLFSFHGIPLRYEQEGDNYRQYCELTVQKVAEKLALNPQDYAMTFQSRFGREPWLTPYTDEFMQKAGQQHEKIAVICPGFSADCLETVEEIEKENRQYFLQGGGKDFVYIPALNTNPLHISAMVDILAPKIG